MEQLVARRAHNPKVIGSSPIPAIFVHENSYVKKKLIFVISPHSYDFYLLDLILYRE